MEASVSTYRNREVICHAGFQYLFDKLSADQVTKFYRCRRRDINCKGRIRINNDGRIEITGMHGGHDESAVDIEVSV